MRLNRPGHQVLVLITCSFLIGLGFNLFRNRPLPLLANHLELAEPGDDITLTCQFEESSSFTSV